MNTKERPNFTFRLSSPQYRRFLDFIASDKGVTPGKILNELIFERVDVVLSFRASEKAHKEVDPEFAHEFDTAAFSWLDGGVSRHWTKLTSIIGYEKAKSYQDRFLPLYHKFYDEISEAAGLDYRNLERRWELAESDGE
jgi:hypothetical protein